MGLRGGIVLVTGLAVTAAWLSHHVGMPRNFAAVQPGRIYRGGHQDPAVLRSIVQRHGLKTVLTLRAAGTPGDAEEKELLDRLGVHRIRIDVYSLGDRLTEQLFHAADILADPASHPILVHCWGGTHRTGLVVATYRIRHCGWSLQQAEAELERIGVSRTEDSRDQLIRSTFRRVAARLNWARHRGAP